MLWKQKDAFPDVVLRLGAFHTTCSFLSVIGKRFAEAGLTDLLTMTGIVGLQSVKGVVSGKHYNRAIRVHKLLYEALTRLNLQHLNKSLSSDDAVEWDRLSAVLRKVQETKATATVSSIVNSNDFSRLSSRLEKHSTDLRKASPMAALWLSYLDMVQLLLLFLRATRTQDWSLHLACIRRMLPWFYAYNHTNYARYGTYYWADMSTLSTRNPSAHEALQSGDFCVARSERHFAQVPVDQAIEQTLNRDSKTMGGIVGFSRNPGAVHR